MRTLASYNIKGGVGKTATTVNLAFLAAREGAQTLVWDLDPQGAASYYFRIKPKVKGGSKGLLGAKKEIDDLIKGTDYENLDLLPADFSYRHMDLILDSAKKPTHSLEKAVKPLRDEYDFLIIDCPPSISLLSENVFQAAEALLVPMIPTTLSVRTYDQLLDFLEKHRLSQLQILPFFSMVDLRKRLHREVMDTFSRECPGFLKQYIPNASEIERMGTERAAVPSYAPRGTSAHAYEELWEEVKARLR